MPPPAEPGLQERILAVRERIEAAAGRAGRPGAAVRLLAVTKGQPLEVVRAAAQLGLSELGENYVQECGAKSRALEGSVQVSWHLLGHLQRNKARLAAQLFQVVESLDGLELAGRLSALAPLGRPLQVLLEVELTGEPARTGLGEAELFLVAEAADRLPGLRIMGLMTVASRERPEREFSRCRELAGRLEAELGRQLPVLSMGMSSDFEAAIAEGSTEVRIGTLLFGPRSARAG